MKKLFGIFILFFAFTLNTNAQVAQEKNKKVDEKVEAKKNLNELSQVISLDEKLSSDLMGLFEYKYRNLNENLSDERKAELARIIEAKLRATFSPAQMESIEKKVGLLKKLTN